MLTLTLRHERRHSLDELVVGLRGAWKALQQHRRWKGLRAHLVGTITALEVTCGPNGWHPHLHLLLFLDGQGDELVDELAGWIPQGWKREVGGRLDVAPDLVHGAHLMRLGSDSAKYVAKIADETTRGDLKSDAKSPFALLDRVGDDRQAYAQWQEYSSTMKGRRAIVWSRGLRALLLPDVDELTDEEAAAAEVGGGLLELLPAKAWWRMVMTKTAGVVQAVAHLETWERRLNLGGP